MKRYGKKSLILKVINWFKASKTDYVFYGMDTNCKKLRGLLK